MATNNVSVGLGLTLNTTQYAKALQQTNTKTNKVFSELDAQAQNFAARWEDITRNIRSAKSVASSLVLYSTFTGIAEAAASAASAVADFSMNMETAQVAMRYFMDGADKTAQSLEYLREMQQVAADTSFTTESAVNLSKFMASMGVNIRSVKSVMTTINDAAAATGASEANMQRIVTALGQIMTKGRLAAEEVRQLANANIPIYEILKEEMNLSGSDIANLGNLWLDANDSIVAILSGLQKRYKGAASEIADTIAGMTNSIKDNALMISHVATSGVYDALSDKIRVVRDELSKYREIAVDQGSVGVLRSFTLDMDSSGRFGTQLIALVGDVRNLIGAAKELYITCEPLVTMFGKGLYYSITTLTVGISAFGDVLNGVNDTLKVFNIDLKQLFEVCAGVYIVYRVGHTFGYVGQMAAALIVHLRNTYLSMTSLLPASIAASTGLKVLTGSILVGGAAALYLSGALDTLLESFAGLSTNTGLPDDFESAFDKYMEQMDAYNAAIKEYEGTFDESFESIANKGVGAFNVIQEKASKSAKKASDSWLASFDEVYKVPEDKDTTDDDELTFPDLAALVDKLQYIFPAHIEEELIMPKFDWGSVYDNSDATLSALNAWTPLLLTGLSLSMAHAFKKRYTEEVAKQKQATGPKTGPSGSAADDIAATAKKAQDAYDAADAKVHAAINDATDMLSRKVTDVSASQIEAMRTGIKQANKEYLAAANKLGITVDDAVSPILDKLTIYAKAQEAQSLDNQLADLRRRIAEAYPTRETDTAYEALIESSRKIEKKLNSLLSEVDVSAYYTPQSPFSTKPISFAEDLQRTNEAIEQTTVAIIKQGKNYDASLVARIRPVVEQITALQKRAKELDLTQVLVSLDSQKSALSAYARDIQKLNTLQTERQLRNTNRGEMLQTSDELNSRIMATESSLNETIDALRSNSKVIAENRLTSSLESAIESFNRTLTRTAEDILPAAHTFTDTLTMYAGKGADSLIVAKAQELQSSIESAIQTIYEQSAKYLSTVTVAQVTSARSLSSNGLSTTAILNTLQKDLPQQLSTILTDAGSSALTDEVVSLLREAPDAFNSVPMLTERINAAVHNILKDNSVYSVGILNALVGASDTLDDIKLNAITSGDLSDLVVAYKAGYRGDIPNTLIAKIDELWARGAGSADLGAILQASELSVQDTGLRNALLSVANEVRENQRAGNLAFTADELAQKFRDTIRQQTTQLIQQNTLASASIAADAEIEAITQDAIKSIYGEGNLQQVLAQLNDTLPAYLEEAASGELGAAQRSINTAIEAMRQQLVEATTQYALDNAAEAKALTTLGIDALGQLTDNVTNFLTTTEAILRTYNIPYSDAKNSISLIRDNVLSIAEDTERLLATGTRQAITDTGVQSGLIAMSRIEQDVNNIAGYVKAAAFGTAQDTAELARQLSGDLERLTNAYLQSISTSLANASIKLNPGDITFTDGIAFDTKYFERAIIDAMANTELDDLTAEALEVIRGIGRHDQTISFGFTKHIDTATADKQLLGMLREGLTTYADTAPDTYKAFMPALQAVVARAQHFEDVSLASVIEEMLRTKLKPMITMQSNQLTTVYRALDMLDTSSIATSIEGTLQTTMQRLSDKLAVELMTSDVANRQLISDVQRIFNRVRAEKLGDKSLEKFTAEVLAFADSQTTTKNADIVRQLLQWYTESGAFSRSGAYANSAEGVLSQLRNDTTVEPYRVYRDIYSGKYNSAAIADYLSNTSAPDAYTAPKAYIQQLEVGTIEGRQAALGDITIKDVTYTYADDAFKQLQNAEQFSATAQQLFKTSGFFASAGYMDALVTGNGSLSGYIANIISNALEDEVAQNVSITLPEKTHRRLFNEWRGEVIEKMNLDNFGKVFPVVSDINAYNAIYGTKAQFDAVGQIAGEALPIEIKSTSRMGNFNKLVDSLSRAQGQYMAFIDAAGIHGTAEAAASNAIKAFDIQSFDALQALKEYDSNLFYQLAAQSLTVDKNQILVAITPIVESLNTTLNDKFTELEKTLGKLPTYLGLEENRALSVKYLQSLVGPLMQHRGSLTNDTVMLLVTVSEDMRKEAAAAADTYGKILKQIAANVDAGIGLNEQLVAITRSGTALGSASTLRQLPNFSSFPRSFGLSASVNDFFNNAQKLLLSATAQPQRSISLHSELLDLRERLTLLKNNMPAVLTDKTVAQSVLLESNEIGKLDVRGVSEVNFYKTGGLLDELVTRVDTLLSVQSSLYTRANHDLGRLPAALEGIARNNYSLSGAFFEDGSSIENYLRGFQATLRRLSEATTTELQPTFEQAYKLIKQIADNQNFNIVDFIGQNNGLTDGRLINLRESLMAANADQYLYFLQNISNAATTSAEATAQAADTQQVAAQLIQKYTQDITAARANEEALTAQRAAIRESITGLEIQLSFEGDYSQLDNPAMRQLIQEYTSVDNTLQAATAERSRLEQELARIQDTLTGQNKALNATADATQNIAGDAAATQRLISESATARIDRLTMQAGMTAAEIPVDEHLLSNLGATFTNINLTDTLTDAAQDIGQNIGQQIGDATANVQPGTRAAAGIDDVIQAAMPSSRISKMYSTTFGTYLQDIGDAIKNAFSKVKVGASTAGSMFTNFISGFKNAPWAVLKSMQADDGLVDIFTEALKRSDLSDILRTAQAPSEVILKNVDDLIAYTANAGTTTSGFSKSYMKAVDAVAAELGLTGDQATILKNNFATLLNKLQLNDLGLSNTSAAHVLSKYTDSSMYTDLTKLSEAELSDVVKAAEKQLTAYTEMSRLYADTLEEAARLLEETPGSSFNAAFKQAAKNITGSAHTFDNFTPINGAGANDVFTKMSMYVPEDELAAFTNMQKAASTLQDSQVVARFEELWSKANAAGSLTDETSDALRRAAMEARSVLDTQLSNETAYLQTLRETDSSLREQITAVEKQLANASPEEAGKLTTRLAQLNSKLDQTVSNIKSSEAIIRSNNELFEAAMHISDDAAAALASGPSAEASKFAADAIQKNKAAFAAAEATASATKTAQHAEDFAKVVSSNLAMVDNASVWKTLGKAVGNKLLKGLQYTFKFLFSDFLGIGPLDFISYGIEAFMNAATMSSIQSQAKNSSAGYLMSSFGISEETAKRVNADMGRNAAIDNWLNTYGQTLTSIGTQAVATIAASIGGAIIQGAVTGATATSFTGPGAIIGGIVGGLVSGIASTLALNEGGLSYYNNYANAVRKDQSGYYINMLGKGYSEADAMKYATAAIRDDEVRAALSVYDSKMAYGGSIFSFFSTQELNEYAKSIAKFSGDNSLVSAAYGGTMDRGWGTQGFTDFNDLALQARNAFNYWETEGPAALEEAIKNNEQYYEDWSGTGEKTKQAFDDIRGLYSAYLGAEVNIVRQAMGQHNDTVDAAMNEMTASLDVKSNLYAFKKVADNYTIGEELLGLITGTNVKFNELSDTARIDAFETLSSVYQDLSKQYALDNVAAPQIANLLATQLNTEGITFGALVGESDAVVADMQMLSDYLDLTVVSFDDLTLSAKDAAKQIDGLDTSNIYAYGLSFTKEGEKVEGALENFRNKLAGWTVDLPSMLDIKTLSASDLQILASAGIEITANGVTFAQAQTAGESGAERDLLIDYNTTSKKERDVLSGSAGINLNTDGVVLDTAFIDKNVREAYFDINQSAFGNLSREAASLFSGYKDIIKETGNKEEVVGREYIGEGLGYYDATTGQLAITNAAILRGEKTIEDWLNEVDPNREYFNEAIYDELTALSKELQTTGYREVANGVTWNLDADVTNKLGDLTKTGVAGVTFSEYGDDAWVATASNLGELAAQGINRIKTEDFDKLVEGNDDLISALEALGVQITRGDLYTTFDISDTLTQASKDNALLGLYSYIPDLIDNLSPAFIEFLEKTGRLDKDNSIINWQQQQGSAIAATDWGGYYSVTSLLPADYLQNFENVKTTAREAIDVTKLAGWEMLSFSALTEDEVDSVQNDVDTIVLSFDQIPNQVLYDYALASGIISEETGNWTVDTIKECDEVKKTVAGMRIDEAAAESFADTETVFTDTIAKWREAMKNAEPGLSEDAYGLGALIATAIEQGLQQGMNNLQNSFSLQQAYDNIKLQGKDNRSGDMSDINVNGVATSRKHISSYGLVGDNGQDVYSDSFNTVEKTDTGFKLHFNGSWYEAKNTTNANNAVEQLELMLKAEGTLQPEDDLRYNADGSYIQYIPKNKTTGYANGGILDEDGLYRVAEQNRAEAIIPLENPVVSAHIGAAMTQMLMASSEWKKLAGLQGIQDGGISTRLANERYERNSRLEWQEQEDQVAKMSDAILQRIIPAMSQSSADSSIDNRTPVYVGTLIADETGLRELNKKMRVIEARETRRR